MAPVFSTVSAATVLSPFAFIAICGIVTTITLIAVVLLCLHFRRGNDVVHTKPVQLTYAVNTRTVVEPRQTAAPFEFVELQTITDRTTNGNKRNLNTPIIVESSASSSYLEQIHFRSGSNHFPGKIIPPARDKTMSASAPLLNVPKYVETLTFVETVTSAGSRQFGHGINVSGSADEGVIVDSIDPNGAAAAAAAHCVAKGDRIKSITVLLDNADLDDARAILDYAAAYPIRLEVCKDRSKSSQAAVKAELADPVIRIAGPSTNFWEPTIDSSVVTDLPEVGIDLPDGRNKMVAATPMPNLSVSDRDIKVDPGLESVEGEIHYVRPAEWKSSSSAEDALEVSFESNQLESTIPDESFHVEVNEELPLPAGYIRCVKTPTKVDLSAPSVVGQEPLDFGGSLKRRQIQYPDVVFAEPSGSKVRFLDAPTVYVASASNPSHHDADIHQTKPLQRPTGELAYSGEEPSDFDEPRFVSYTPALASSVKLAEIQAKMDAQSPMADVGDFNISDDVFKSATVDMIVISPVQPPAFGFNSLTKKNVSADGVDGLQSPEVQMETALVGISSNWTLSNRQVTDEDVELEIASPEIGESRSGLSWDDADVIIPDIEATVNEEAPLSFTNDDGAALNASADVNVPSGSVELDPVESDILRTSENATLEIDVSPLQPPQVVHVDSLQAGMMELIMGGGSAGKIIEVGDCSAGAQVHRQPASVSVKAPKKKSRFLSLFQKKPKKKDPSIGAAADTSLDLKAGASPSIELSPASIEVHGPKPLGSVDADLSSAHRANFGAKPYVAATDADSNVVLPSLELSESTEPSELHASANMDLTKPEMDLTPIDVNENKLALDLNDVGFQSRAGLEFDDGNLALEPNFSSAESSGRPALKVNGLVPEVDESLFDELHGLKVEPASLDLEASSDIREPGASVNLEPNVQPLMNSPVLTAEESMTLNTTSSTSLQFSSDSPKVNLSIDEPDKGMETGGFIEPAVDIDVGLGSPTLESPSLSVSNVSSSAEKLQQQADAALKVDLNDQPTVHGLSASVDPNVEINASVVRPSHPKEEKKSKGIFGGIFKSRSKKDKGKASVKGPTSPAAVDVGHTSVGVAAGQKSGQKSAQRQVNVGTLPAYETSGEFVGITASGSGASVNVGNVHASGLETDDKNSASGIELPEAELTGEQIHVETPTLQPTTLNVSTDLKSEDKCLAPDTELPVVPLNADGQLFIEPEVELNKTKTLNLAVDMEEPRVNFNSSGSAEMQAIDASFSSPSSPAVAISGDSEVNVEQIRPTVAVTAAQPTVHVDVKGHKKESGGFGGNFKNFFKPKAKKHEKQETAKVSVNGNPNMALSSGAADHVSTTQPTITANHTAIVVAEPEKFDDHLHTSGACLEADSTADVGSSLLSVEAQSELDVGLELTQTDGATVSLDDGLSGAEQALLTLRQDSPSVPSSVEVNDFVVVDAESQEQLQTSLSDQNDSRLSVDSGEYDINVGERLDMGLNAEDMFETIGFRSPSSSASPSGKISHETKFDSSRSVVDPVGINGGNAGKIDILASVGEENRVTHDVDNSESAPPPLPTAAAPPLSIHLTNGKAGDYDDDDEDDVRQPDDSIENEAVSTKREILSLHGLPRSEMSVKSDVLIDSGDLNNNDQEVQSSEA